MDQPVELDTLPSTPTTGHHEVITNEDSLAAADETPACSACRKRKLKCSREVPACQHCRKIGSECVYAAKRGKPGIKAGAVEKVNRRLDELERRLLQQERSAPVCHHDSGLDCLKGSFRNKRASTDQEKAYDLVSFFARELQKFSEKSDSPALPTEQQQQHHPCAPDPIDLDAARKRRRLDDEDYSRPQSNIGVFPTLPAPPVLEAVLQAYFAHLHPWIPMLHESRFRQRLQDTREKHNLEVILHAMTLVAARFVENKNVSHSLTREYRQMEQLRNWIVATSMNNLSVENLQALIIVAFNDIGNGEGAKAWSLVGSLTRTVEYLQLTVEDEENKRQTLLKPFISLLPPKDATEMEERRRVFWNVFKLDRFCSVMTGWNTSLTSDDVCRRLPCDGILWRKREPAVTPYFGIWDKSAGRIGKPISFLPAHYPSPSVNADDELQSPVADVVVSPKDQQERQLQPVAIDMSTVGAFAYCIEATESLSRVTTYFLQQKIDTRDPREIGCLLMRFKELDLRLVHWKILLPQKWKANPSRKQAMMDPNLTLAHVTHNASMILLHQLIAFPPAEWELKVKLPSSCSAETCQVAAVEIAIITQYFLKNTTGHRSIPSQFAFCVYIAARVLLVHCRYYRDTGGQAIPEFWSLVQSLKEMSRCWAGHLYPQERGTSNLAGKYAEKLIELHDKCSNDDGFLINVLGYTVEIGHMTANDPPTAAIQCESICDNTLGSSFPPSINQEEQGQTTNSAIDQTKYTVNSIHTPSVMQPQAHQRGVSDLDHLSAISQILLDQQFLEMDRIISFDDGMFSESLDNSGWQ